MIHATRASTKGGIALEDRHRFYQHEVDIEHAREIGVRAMVCTPSLALRIEIAGSQGRPLFMIPPIAIDRASKSLEVRGYIAKKSLLFGQSDWRRTIMVSRVDGVEGCRWQGDAVRH